MSEPSPEPQARGAEPSGSARGAPASVPGHPPGGVGGVVWLHGGLRPASEAVVSAFDHGFLLGDGVFETVEVRAGQPVALTRHLARLARSATGLGLEVGAGADAGWRQAVAAVVDANGPGADGRLRLTVTSGPGPLGARRGGPITLLVAWAPPAGWPAAARVALAPWRRNEHDVLAGLKTTSYAGQARVAAWLAERGADEALFANTAGNLCEASSANVFVVWRGRLCTPPLSSGCLGGVTRDLLLEVTGADETDVPVDALGEVTEAFLSSATRGVLPITALDGRDLPAPGPAAAAASAAYRALLDRTLDP